MVTYRYSAGSP